MKKRIRKSMTTLQKLPKIRLQLQMRKRVSYLRHLPRSTIIIKSTTTKRVRRNLAKTGLPLLKRRERSIQRVPLLNI
jgi:hypothetical protein